MKNITNLLLIFALIFVFNAGEYFGQSKQPTLKYLGNSFVKLTTSTGKVIYIDPYAVNTPDSADIILVTHEHECHNDLTRVIPKKECTIIRAATALIGGIYKNFTIGEVKISAKPAYNKYHSKEEGVGYLLEFDGIKVYQAGGSAKIPEMEELTNEKIDYALYHMTPGPEEMTQAAIVVNAKHDIPIHSNVSLERQVNQGLIDRFTSPNKLVLVNDQVINLVHESEPKPGNVLRVPQDYSSIQAAINASQNGDTVLVSEGVYYENINYKGKGIVVTSKFIQTKNWQTVRNTIIDGSKCENKDTASTVQFLNLEDSTAVLEGFTITGGTGTKYMFPNGNGSKPWQEGAGVVMHFSSAVVRNNYITKNTMTPKPGVTNGGGGGIASMYGSPKIYNNVIVSNVSGYAGGIVLNWSGGTIKNNIVFHNIGGTSGGNGGIMCWYVPKNSALVENNTIVGNISLTTAGGIDIMVNDAATIPVVKNNIVWGNRQASGGQIRNPQYSFYNNVEDYSSGTNISSFPQFQDSTFILSETSPCIDNGDPADIYSDIENPVISGKALPPSKGNLRNDIGAFGGTLSRSLMQIDVSDIYTPSKTHNLLGQTGKEGIYRIELINFSSHSIRIDSLSVQNKNIFKVSSKLDVHFDKSNRILGVLENDTISVNYNPVTAGAINDTIKVYHNVPGISNPMRIPIKLSVTAVGVNEENSLPNEFKLLQNVPNPFNPSTRIMFNVARKSNVTLKIYDILGRVVDNLINEEMEAGEYQVTWNPKNGICSGVYLVNIVADNFRDTKKMIYQK